MSTTVVPDPDPYAWASDRAEEDRPLLAQSGCLTVTPRLYAVTSAGTSTPRVRRGDNPTL